MSQNLKIVMNGSDQFSKLENSIFEKAEEVD